MVDNPARTVALAIAEDICSSCVCCDQYGEQKTFFRDSKDPCPFFHPDNFYYDSDLKRFWCRNWVDEDGNEKPPKTP